MKASTGWPFLKATTVGIDWEPVILAICEKTPGFLSTSIFTIFTAPLFSSTTFSSSGAERAARPAPGRPEVDDDGRRLRRLDHVGHEGLVGAVDDVRALGSAGRGPSCASADDVHENSS